MMKKYILLKVNLELFYKLKSHKFRLEKKEKRKIAWEEYVEYLFGFKPKL